MGRSAYSQFVEATIVEAPADGWLQGVAEAAQPIFERAGGHGAAVVIAKPGAEGRTFRFPGATAAMTFIVDDRTWPDMVKGPVGARAFRPFSTTLVSAQLGRATMRGMPAWDGAMRRTGERWSDAVGACFTGSYGVGILCSVLGEDDFDASRWRDIKLMRRHLVSTVHARLTLATTDDADAVLTPRGEVAHTPRALGAGTRALLGAAVRALEATRRGADSVSEGDRIWNELLAGGWSAVERVDRDGKRLLLLARASEHPGLAISPDERAILELVEAGRSNKQIAIELGVSDAAVSVRLRDTLRKLGCRSTVEYLRFASHRGQP